MCRKLLERKSEVERFYRLATRLDVVAVRLARGRPAIDMALGEVFCRLSVGKRLLDLHCTSMVMFANEKLGMTPRTFFSLMKLARDLRERPLLKQAVLAGEVLPGKARVVMGLAVGKEEAAWTALAMEHSTAKLKELLREQGGEGDPSSAFGFETLRLAMTPAQQDRLDYALHLAKEFHGYDAPRWKLTQALAREWLARRNLREADPQALQNLDVEASLEELKNKKDEINLQLKAHLEALDFATEEEPDDGENATGLFALAKRLLARRERFDEPLGRVLSRMAKNELWWFVGFGSFEEYCQERLGISASTAKQRIRLERRMERLPALRVALKTGRLTYTKALLVARHATPRDVLERIAEAAKTTHQQTKREADREEDLKDRARGVRKVRGPRAALEVVSEAIASARQMFAVDGRRIGPGEALFHIGEYYIARWEVPLGKHGWRRKWEREVMQRHGGLCAVPGCTRPAGENHHIIFQKDGGPDEPWNCVALCRAHHLKCVHGNRLRVRGRGGEHLVWEFLDGRLRVCERWETSGRDDVRLAPSGAAVAAL